MASASPRRRELMSKLGLCYRPIDTNVRETPMGLPPAEHARLLARKKTLRAAEILSGRRAKRPGYVIIGADTVVALGRMIYGKPKSCRDARLQLSRLSGRNHVVITGLTILDTERGVSVTASEISFVRMRRLRESEIEAYVRSGEPAGKAGSYAIQGSGRGLVAALKGDYFNVVGFPVRLFARLAPAFGLRVSKNRIESLYRRIPPLNRRRAKYAS